jgi:hypothetical protein
MPVSEADKGSPGRAEFLLVALLLQGSVRRFNVKLSQIGSAKDTSCVTDSESLTLSCLKRIIDRETETFSPTGIRGPDIRCCGCILNVSCIEKFFNRPHHHRAEAIACMVYPHGCAPLPSTARGTTTVKLECC